jgi:hypothetical protein
MYYCLFLDLHDCLQQHCCITCCRNTFKFALLCGNLSWFAISLQSHNINLVLFFCYITLPLYFFHSSSLSLCGNFLQFTIVLKYALILLLYCFLVACPFHCNSCKIKSMCSFCVTISWSSLTFYMMSPTFLWQLCYNYFGL